jgi:hypothetical protein
MTKRDCARSSEEIGISRAIYGILIPKTPWSLAFFIGGKNERAAHQAEIAASVYESKFQFP